VISAFIALLEPKLHCQLQPTKGSVAAKFQVLNPAGGGFAGCAPWQPFHN
jgi:hypothetical protein